jgi:predicted PurR-regulated permease PerM
MLGCPIIVRVMTDSVEPEPETTDTEVEVPTAPSAAPATPPVRYKPMSLPSAPFWLALIAAVAGLAILVASWSVLFMFAIGLVLFAVLLPLVNWMTRRGLGRAVASMIVVAVSLVIAIAAGLLVLKVIFDQLLPFVASIPEYLEEIKATAPPLVASAVQTILDTIYTATANVDVGVVVLGFLQGILGLAGVALGLTILPFFIFYLLVDQPKMSRGLREDIPSPWRPYIDTAIQIFVNDFAQYFKAELIVGAIQGTIVFVGLFLIGLVVGSPLADYVLLLAVIAAVMELLPQIGPIIALIPALLLALATSPLAFALVLVFYLIVFIIEANVLVPTIEGKVVEFSRATVIVLIAVGFAIGGIVGGILAMPVAAIIRDLFGFIFRQVERDSLTEANATEP